MKTFSIPWQGLLIMAGLLYGAAGAAQVVRVPANVNVVDPGIGGIGGFGGDVGHGGIVCMPDPETVPDVSLFNGGTVISWRLLGDISILANQSPPTPAIQSAGAAQAVKIMSYNKSVRLGYEQPIVPYISRSKGEVTVTYLSGACNRFITYQILKTWTTPNPAIIGPNCWQANQTYVYAVDIASGDNVLDQIGFDKYYWQATDAANTVFGTFANNSAESSSVVFTTPATVPFGLLVPPFTLKCCYGQCNSTTAFPGPNPNNTLSLNLTEMLTMSSCVTKPIGGLPQPSTLFPACIPIGTTVWPTINISPLPGYSYTYTAPCAWILTPSGGQGEDLTITGIDGNPCTITQTMVGPCGTQVFTYVINRNFANIQPALTLSSFCVLAGANFTVSFPSSALNNCATWVVRNSLNQVVNWFGTPGNGTNSVRTFTIPNGTTVGAYTVCATSCTCPGSSCITVNVRPTAPVITGPVCVPFGNAGLQLYQCNAQGGVGSYTWTNTFTPAWVPTPASTTTNINLNAVGNNGGQVRVIANGTNICNSAQTIYTVNRTPTAPIVNQPLCFNIGMPGTAIFNVTNPQTSSPANSYTWSFPAGFSTAGGTSGTSVARTTLGIPGTFTCTVTNTNSCGTIQQTFFVTIQPFGIYAVGAQEFASYTSVCASPLNLASYQLWNCTTLANLTTQIGLGAQCFSLDGVELLGSYSITMPIPNGCFVRPPCVATDWNAMEPIGGGTNDQGVRAPEAMQKVLLSPNPNTGEFTLDVLKDFTNGTAMLYDAKGSAIGTLVRLNNGRNNLGASDLAPGVYTLAIELDGEVENRSVVVTED